MFRIASQKKRIMIVFYILIGFFLLLTFYLFVLHQPRNDRNWELGFEKTPEIVQDKNIVTLYHVRDFQYIPDKQVGFGYIQRKLDTEKIKNAWFVIEPFPLEHIKDVGAVAHTYFVFDIEGEDPIAVSVEARREKGEKYNAFWGIFNSYELIYVWASEKDITGRRILMEHNKVYMYPLQISQEETKAVFLQLAKTTHELETKPRFYNTLFSNCTNELAKNANKVKKGSIPFNISLFLPGFADKKLYEYGYIPHDAPFEEIQKRYYISDLVKEIYDESDFSSELRKHLGT